MNKWAELIVCHVRKHLRLELEETCFDLALLKTSCGQEMNWD